MWCEVMHFSILSEWYLKWFTIVECKLFCMKWAMLLLFVSHTISQFPLQPDQAQRNLNPDIHSCILSFLSFYLSFTLIHFYWLAIQSSDEYRLLSVVIINIMICTIDFIFCIICVHIFSSMCAWMDHLYAADRVLHKQTTYTDTRRSEAIICQLLAIGNGRTAHTQKNKIECTARRIFLKQLNSLRRLCECVCLFKFCGNNDFFLFLANTHESKKEIPCTDRHLKHLTIFCCCCCCFHYFAFWAHQLIATDCGINKLTMDSIVLLTQAYKFFVFILGLGLLLIYVCIHFPAFQMVV